MTKNTFQLEYDPETKMSYVRKIVDEIQKNHQETNEEIITGFMPQMIQPNGMPHKLCPVRAFENYLGKLNPNSDKLWQRPLRKLPKDPSLPWYQKENIGHNTHEKFMSKISEDLNLSKRYTNHWHPCYRSHEFNKSELYCQTGDVHNTPQKC